MFTWATVLQAVEREIDMEGEDFCSVAEMIGYGQRAVNKLEALTVTINEDYFLDTAQLSLVSGQSAYDLPTGIYAHKIRRIFYVDGSNNYKITKIKNLDDTVSLQAGEDYKYLILNTAADGAKIKLYPTPSVDGNLVTIFFLRNTPDIVDGTTVIEIPEGFDYVVQYVKDSIINKERQMPDAPPSASLLEQEKIFIETLSNKIPDDDNELSPNADLLIGNVALESELS